MSESANDVLAFLIIECNVPLPYSEAQELTAADPLFKALFRAWENKTRRENEGYALIASSIYNSQGAKTTPSDFLPKKKKTQKEYEAELKAKILIYNQSVAGDSAR